MIMRTTLSPLVWGKTESERRYGFVMILFDEYRLRTVFMHFS